MALTEIQVFFEALHVKKRKSIENVRLLSAEHRPYRPILRSSCDPTLMIAGESFVFTFSFLLKYM